jgi:hypothetical protein
MSVPLSRRTILSAVLPTTLLPAAQIFDGRSLYGWHIVDGPPSAFAIEDGSITARPESDFPCWLRSAREYENFDFRCEIFIKGWSDGGISIHAPEHGRATWHGKQVKIFHQLDPVPKSNSMGAVFPLIAPSKVNVRNKGEWNQVRILMDWPSLRVWINGDLVQNLDVASNPDLCFRARRGYLGLSALGYPIRFRALSIRELPGKEVWLPLFEQQADIEKNWFISEGLAPRPGRPPVRFQGSGGVLRGEGIGHIATRERFRDFELQLYVRGPRHHNGGVLFRSEGKGLEGKRHYEIQLHNVEDAHFPTGSLYYTARSSYPRIKDDEWFPMQLIVQGPRCVVRVNGDTVLDYGRLEELAEGHIELQAHQPGSWLEFKHVRIKRL